MKGRDGDRPAFQTPGSFPTDLDGLSQYLRVARNMSHGDDDLMQELALSALNSLRKGETDRGRIIRRMFCDRMDYWQGYSSVTRWGISVDNGHWNRRQQRLSYDDGKVWVDPRDSVEDVALFNVCRERLVRAMTEKERRYYEQRTAGFNTSSKDHTAMCREYLLRKGLREKVRQFLEV